VRAHVQVIVAALVLLIAGWVAWTLMFGGEGAPQLVLVGVEGAVSLQSPDGAERDAAEGDRLNAQDHLTVGADGSALLSMGEGTRLQLEPKSAIRILEADGAGVRVELEGGRVQASVRPGSPVLGISSRGRAVVARDATFKVGVDPDGAFAVEAEAGTLELQGFEGHSQLKEHQRLIDVPGAASVVDAATTELLLSVRWPEEPTRADRAHVRGRTSPFAEVIVRPDKGAGLRVRAGADGQFDAQLPLQEGNNAITVVARDPNGRKSQAEGSVARDSEAPTATRVEVGWGP
jgi:hypothetical protein